ncbi:MAG: hypothetical protein ACRCYO_04990 [Bacteroidia bacterium]
MKKTTTKLAILSSFLLLLAVAVYTTACNKNKECKAVVTVLSQATGNPIPGAEIRLKPGTGDIEDMIERSDASGKASFTTELPKIMDIFVNGNNSGSVVRFEEGKTDEVTVRQ